MIICAATGGDRWTMIRDQLAANAACLLRQGSFAVKAASGRRVWVLRFRVRENGRTRQRSITMETYELMAKAETWLKELRQILVWLRELNACTRFAAWVSFHFGGRPLPHNWGPKRRRRCSAQ